MRNEKGITLIALVITVIILLILAGVAMSMITGNGGIFTKANEAEPVQGLMGMLENYVGGGSNTPVTPIPITEAITDSNIKDHIGDYIDLGTSILSTTVLPGKVEPYYVNFTYPRSDETIKADYRIFYVEGNTVYAILADYLPNSSNIVKNSGIANIQQVKNRTYIVNGTNNATTLAAALAGPYTRQNNATVVNALTGSKLAGKNVSVALSPTAELLQNSYNAKNPSENINYTSNPTLDVKQSLYVPRLTYSNIDNTDGYWLASSDSTNHEGIVDFNGGVYSSYYRSVDYGVRPVVSLSSDVLVEWSSTKGLWEVK